MIFKWFLRKKKPKKICSDCKTGAISLSVDRRQWACPYSVSCTGDSCVYYEKLDKESKKL